MKSQRGFMSPLFGVVIVIILAVVIIGRNSSISNKLLDVKTDSTQRDMENSIEAVTMALANTSGIEFQVNTSLATLPSVEITVPEFTNVIDLNNPERFMLTSNLTDRKFNKNDSKYELVSNAVFRNVSITLYPSNKEALGASPIARVGASDYSFDSIKSSKMEPMNVGGNYFHKEILQDAKTGLNISDIGKTGETIRKDFEGINIFYPIETGEKISGKYYLR